MSRTSCPEEDSVLRAVRAGELSEPLATHASGCAVCREVVQASHWMQVLAQGAAQGASLPDAKWVWWNAQLAGRRKKAEGTFTLLETLEIISGAGVPIALATWVAWNWYGIQGLATELLAGQLRFPAVEYVLAMLAPAALFLIVISFAYPLLVRD